MNEDKKITVNYNDRFSGSFLFSDPEFEELFLKEIWTDRYYFAHGAEIKQGDKVLDIGAHIGMFSILAEKLGATVWAFEPVRTTYNRLLNHIALNDCKNIKAFHGAVLGQGGTKHVNYPKTNREKNTGKAYMSETTTADYTPELTKVYGINDILFEIGKLDMLKLDCESSEYEILRAIPTEVFEDIRQISMEFHPDPMHPDWQALEAGKELAKYLESVGYRVKLDWSYGQQGRIVALR